MSTGKVWLVGAGPSDPGLFTLKGKAVLEQADVVVHDRLIGPGVLQMIPPGARRIDVGKQAGNHKVVQEKINQILLDEALAGKKVVRLKGGDPFLFGRGGEELELLKAHGVPFEIVPGITSAVSVPAYAGIPVTHRDYTPSVHIITGHRRQGSRSSIDYAGLAGLGDVTLVFLMGVSALPEISAGLIRAGKDPDTPAAVLERGTTAGQRRVVSTLQSLPDDALRAKIGTPGIIVVGKVCALAEEFHWAEDRTLGMARVIVTRPREKQSGLSQKLAMLGAEVIELPSIETVPLSDKGHLDELVFAHYQWMVFTSEAGVRYFWEYLREKRIDIRSLAHIRFAVVGTATKKALEERGILVDYMPDTFNGKALGDGLAEQVGDVERVLVFTPADTPSDCADILTERGCSVTTAAVYRTRYLPQEALELRPEDYVVFTSASTVKGFVQSMDMDDFHEVTAVCIGEKTAKEAGKYQMRTEVSEEATIASLIDKIIQLHIERSKAD